MHKPLVFASIGMIMALDLKMFLVCICFDSQIDESLLPLILGGLQILTSKGFKLADIRILKNA